MHPIIGKVIALNQYLVNVRTLPAKDIRNVYVNSLLSSADVLFIQAMREVRGKDYLKRATETIEEITAKSYLIYSLHGWSNKVTAQIDAMCEDITAELYKADAVNKSQNHEV
ncbi:MAG: hypothetical protein IJQ20_03100 [Paludibacteraceae bacterium]|nr:hypothetical protein [Paludibacteraceae bacterium]